jgi:hypothetical protein
MVIANSSGQCLEAPHSRTARLKRQMSKSKYQMVVALRAVIDGVLDKEPGSMERRFLFTDMAREQGNKISVRAHWIFLDSKSTSR